MPLPKTVSFSATESLIGHGALGELITRHDEWFKSENGGAPVELRNTDFEFLSAHGRLIFSCWTETGVRTWRINSWKWTGDKLSLTATRRMGAELATIELIPRASARALMAGIAAARQLRCEKLAALTVQTLIEIQDETATEKPVPVWLKIERAAVSPGMRRDQPGRFARIIL